MTSASLDAPLSVDAPTLNTSLSCRNVVRYLGVEENRVQVLRSVSLDLFPGKTYSIVGPSGCGKSSLLYLLGLLDRPDGGKIFIGQQDVSLLTDDEATDIRNSELGFIFQFHFLLPQFTAAENVMIPMRRLGLLSEDEMMTRAVALLSAVGLGNKANRRANHLSGGEQQRVAVARSLANEPKVILADEPTGNLDSANSNRAFDLMAQIVREANLSLLIVTHNPAIAKAADITLEMRDGQFVNR
jgi:lipoprotein-releasing system ATP-binding protein